VTLDTGICTIFHRTDTAEPGDMPSWTYTVRHQSWYKTLDFATSPAWPAQQREELQTDLRIRVLQNTAIRQDDAVILRYLTDYSQKTDADAEYTVERAWHGKDDDGPTPITDLNLREVIP